MRPRTLALVYREACVTLICIRVICEARDLEFFTLLLGSDPKVCKNVQWVLR